MPPPPRYSATSSRSRRRPRERRPKRRGTNSPEVRWHVGGIAGGAAARRRDPEGNQRRAHRRRLRDRRHDGRARGRRPGVRGRRCAGRAPGARGARRRAQEPGCGRPRLLLRRGPDGDRRSHRAHALAPRERRDPPRVHRANPRRDHVLRRTDLRSDRGRRARTQRDQGRGAVRGGTADHGRCVRPREPDPRRDTRARLPRADPADALRGRSGGHGLHRLDGGRRHHDARPRGVGLLGGGGRGGDGRARAAHLHGRERRHERRPARGGGRQAAGVDLVCGSG